MFNRRLKIYFLGFWLLLLAGVTIAIFWFNEYRYTLPTPVPSNYRAVKNGVRISLGDRIPDIGNKPLLLHFFNPVCPCSRFNITHVKALAETYSGKVGFVIVVVGNRPFDAEKIREKFALNIPVIADEGLSIQCGVYSTPQAAILTGKRSLFYRGNYNRSRYCTDAKTAFAKQALDNLVSKRSNSMSSVLAITSYGCQLDE